MFDQSVILKIKQLKYWQMFQPTRIEITNHCLITRYKNIDLEHLLERLLLQ